MCPNAVASGVIRNGNVGLWEKRVSSFSLPEEVNNMYTIKQRGWMKYDVTNE